ncbi:MAG: O-antigen ligase family protein [Aureliella sp.]
MDHGIEALGGNGRRFMGLLNGCIETVLHTQLLLSPWAFGCVHPAFEFYLVVATAVIALLTAAKLVFSSDEVWRLDRLGTAVFLALAGLALVASLHTVRLPKPFVTLLSPNLVTNVDRLMPSEPEVVRVAEIVRVNEATSPEDGAPDLTDVARFAAADHLSFYPAGSLQFSIRIVAILVLIYAVSTLPRPRATLHRMSVMALVLGTAIAIFSIAQEVGDEGGRMFWFFETNAIFFGPFINKNHFPFLMNMAIGLSFGLLLAEIRKAKGSWLLAFQSEKTLAISACLTFMIASVFFSLSRGGVVSLGCAIGVLTVVMLSRDESRTDRAKVAIGLAGLLVTLCVCLGAWFGLEAVSERYSTLSTGAAYQDDGRWQLWSSAIQVACDYPLFGSGGETYRYWETILRFGDVGDQASLVALRADNEFLDIAAEYGLFAGIGVLAVAACLLFKTYLLARTPDSDLALGALMAICAVTIHSCLDFGLRVPSNAILAAAVAALVCTKWRTIEETQKPIAGGGETIGIRLAAATLCSVASVLPVLALTRARAAETWRLAAFEAFENGDYSRSAACLDQYVACEPENIETRITACRFMFLCAEGLNQRDGLNQSEAERVRAAALKNAIAARELCPLAWQPHAWLAEHHDLLNAGDSKETYLTRASFLNPSDPKIALNLGLNLIAGGKNAEGWKELGRSLELSMQDLDTVFNYAKSELSVSQMLDVLLPADPAIYLKLSEFPEVQAEDQQLLVERSLEVLLSGEKEDFALIAECQVRLGLNEEAITTLQRGLRASPDSERMALELATIQLQIGREKDAAATLKKLLLFHPSSAQAEQMLESID